MTSTPEQTLANLEDTANLLKKTQINLKKCPKQRLSPVYIECRLKCIEEYWHTFRTLHQELVKCTPREKRINVPYFCNEDYYVYEDLYFCLQADLKEMLSQFKSNQGTEQSLINSDTTSLVRLPKIQLPIFSGKYEEWATFQDLYMALVHNNTSISNVQKLHYLKTSVAGEAETLLKHIQITSDNYLQAWETLKQRYGNKRIIVNSVMKRLFNQKKMTTQSATQIKSLLDTTVECINNLKNMSLKVDSWDPIIIYLIVQKLDQETHKDWEEYAYKENSQEMPQWDELHKFLESKFRTLELVTPTTSTTYTSREKPIRERSFHAATTDKICFMCKENHTLCHCNNFTKMNVTERNNYVKENRLCFNCLSQGHAVFKCRVPVSCRICRRRHHSLLHEQRTTDTLAEPENPTMQPTLSTHLNIEEQENEHTMIASHYTMSNKQGTALLATAMVKVKSERGDNIMLRALIDQGSQACFISEKAAQLLKLKRQPAKGNVTGVGSTVTSIKHVVQIEVSPRWETHYNLHIQAYVMSKQLTTKIPQNTININNRWQHLDNIELADPSYYTSGSIDLLLGVKEYAQILQNELIKGPPGAPCAQKTTLGWILFGEIYTIQHDNKIIVMHHQVDIDEMLKTLWEIDTDTSRVQTRDEQLCENIYNSTHTRNNEGRYIVKLPFKTDNPKSVNGNTRDIALHRLLQLERKFIRQPDLKREYVKVIDEYKNLKHMEEIPEKEINNKAVYLPHHAVIREDKETTKTRVVFDASAKGNNGVSLNDELLLGPVLQDDLRSIIMRWRLHAICYVADIKKMYRMILISKDQTDFQRILWREEPTEEVKDYRLLTVTFGTASAPYLAIKTLQQLAFDEGEQYEHGKHTLLQDFYVDDVLSGADSVEKAIEASKQLQEIMQKGGFELTKWSSNSFDFMKSINPEKRSFNATLDFNMDKTIKALGVTWNMKDDQFLYNFNLQSIPTDITKRSILSDIQKLFDPLGWIAPSIVTAKILVQRLWSERVGWDEDISLSLTKEWTNIRADFKNVNDIKINRWMNTTNINRDNIQIHGFSDASIQAYAAAVYVRVIQSDGTIKTNLIAARTRVAPLKTISLPRLELCGAVLLSRLLKHIEQALKIPTSQIHAWTDSTIVLSWLSGEPNRWKPFVANRVVEIISNVHNKQWYHVKSNDNPADIASRGMLVSNLKESDLWWQGPNWLYEQNINFKTPENIYTDLERKKENININLKINSDINETTLTNQFESFENLSELIGTLTLCKRFINYRKFTNVEKPFTNKELEDTLQRCIQLVQNEQFEDEIIRLRNKKPVKNRSILKSLNPFLDDHNILRVGGRLANADINYEAKHPIILGNKHTLVKLIVADAHLKTLHGGVQLTLCYLRSKYWIIRAKGLVKFHVHKCLICARQSATARTQIMGDLPEVRVTPSRAFLRSGVDFAGPFQILFSKGRGAKTSKAYIAIFVCMATKAIHLELVGDMTSEAFIGAFKRFTARRGKCTDIWSDQGRNFVGASKELVEAWRESKLEFTGQISDSLLSDGTQWHFIPAYSPNFGGLWEAGVKSIKYHLKRILTSHLTFEEMSTVLCQIEACLNSRPLCPIDDSDIENTEPLTPGHFLIGEAPIAIPSPNLTHVKVSYLSRWQHTQKLTRDFWQRWVQEYLSRLQQRPKWLKKENEFKKGQIVLIKTDNLPPGKWALGRITDKHPGKDGMTRVYSVKSGDNITKRCITKLCSLPIDSDS